MTQPKEQIRMIPISRIDIVVQARPLNLAHVQRLKASIQDEGLKNPITAYERGDRFVLGPGAHRLAAYKELEFHEIPAIVRPDAGDDVIRREQMIENLQRENMTPIEEARALEKLQEEIQNLDQLAVIAGKTRKWIEQRLSFMRLTPRVQQLVDDGLLPIEHAYQIARVASPERQEEIAGMVSAAAPEERKKMPWLDGRASDLETVRNMVEQSLRDLKGVQWKLDVPFEGLPACVTCPHNSANQPTLFDTAEKVHRCLEPGCFSQKTKLASSGVRKSVNHMNKEELAATPKNAETAIAAREVTFVEPKAVVDYAKTAAAPKKKTKSESRSRENAENDWRIQAAHRDAVREWRENLQDKIVSLLRGDQTRLAMFLLIKELPAFEDLDIGSWRDALTQPEKKRRDLAERIIFPFLDLLKNPTSANLQRVVDNLQFDKKGHPDDWPLRHDDLPDGTLNHLCGIFGIEIPAKPTIDQFKPKKPDPAPAAEASKQPAAAAGKTPAKAAKKKPAAKKSATKKKKGKK